MSGSNAQDRPIVSVRIHPRNADTRRLYEELGRIIDRYPSIKIALDPDSKEISILGKDEMQLKQVTAQTRRSSGMALEVGEPEVIYLDTIRQLSQSESRYIKQTGGCGNYAHVKLRLEPIEPEVLAFISTVNSETIPEKYIPAVEQGVRQAAMGGEGNEIVAVRVVLYDGSYHEIDSNEKAFGIAGATAFNEGVAKAGRVLLEPIMAIELPIPEEYAPIVKQDFTNRRGRVTGLDRRNNTAVIHAIAPLAEMLGYRNRELKMQFLRYAKVPLPEEYGDDEAGIPSIKPSGPRPKQGFAKSDLEFD